VVCNSSNTTTTTTTNNNNNNNDKVTKVFHQEVAKQTHALEKPYSAYYKYEPQLILENYNYILYWDCTEAPFIGIESL
jgi:hypothetical protein